MKLIKNSNKKITALGLLLSMGMLSACPGGDKGGGAPPPPAVVMPVAGALNTAGCANCFSNPALMFHATHSTDFANYDLSFFGDGAILNASGVPWVLRYNGPTAVSGFIDIKQTVTTNVGYGNCQILAGRYNIQTVSAGNWSNLATYGANIQAVGPSMLNLQIVEGTLPVKSPNGDYWTFYSQPSTNGTWLSFEVQYSLGNQGICGVDKYFNLYGF